MKWKLTEREYLYDGSIEGLFSIIYNCIFLKELPNVITTEENYVANLLETPTFITTDLNKAKIINGKLENISKFTAANVYKAFLSGDLNKEMIILKYVIKSFKHKNALNFMRNRQCVIDMETICKQVGLEAHRFKGFLRFEELAAGVLYARFEPDNNILEYQARHFKLRLPNEKWIIHDLKRQIMAIYDTKKVIYADAVAFSAPFFKDKFNQDNFEEMWKEYYQNITIKERTNKRCRKNFMPVRYWKNMLEVEEEYKWEKI